MAMLNDKKAQSSHLNDDDRFFILSLMSLPPEKKALIQGILIGMNLQVRRQGKEMNLQNGNKDTISQS